MDWSTNNSITTLHRHEYDLSQIEIIAVIFIYTFVSILAVGGNLTVLYLIAKFPSLRSPTNFLIANLAVADLSMAIFCIPFSYWPLLVLSYWPFGLAPCKLIFFMQAVTVMCSAYTLVAISCDRFVAVMFPMRRAYRFTVYKAAVSILIIWMGSAFVACPLIIVLGVYVDEDGSLQCDEFWPDGSGAENVYSLFLSVVQFLIPFCVFILTYLIIGVRLWTTRVPGENNYELNKVRKESVKKLIPTVLIITSVFAICWIPQNVLNIWTGIDPSIRLHPDILRIWWGCHLTAMSHSFVNPAIYVLRNRKFRDGFAYCFSCLPCVDYSGNLHNLSIRRGNTCRRFTSSEVDILQNAQLNNNSVYFYEPSITKLQHRTSGLLARVISNNNFYSGDHHHCPGSPHMGGCSKNGRSKKCGRNAALASVTGKRYSRVPSNCRDFEGRMSSFAARSTRSAGGKNNSKLKTTISYREGHTDSYA